MNAGRIYIMRLSVLRVFPYDSRLAPVQQHKVGSNSFGLSFLSTLQASFASTKLSETWEQFDAAFPALGLL